MHRISLLIAAMALSGAPATAAGRAATATDTAERTSGSATWQGYRRPASGDWRTPVTAAPCPAIGVQNLDPGDIADLLAAVAEMCDALADPRFADAVTATDNWLVSCASAGVAGPSISGAAVLARLNPASIRFSLVLRQPMGGRTSERTIAVANIGRQAIALRPERLARWRSGDPDQQFATIRTLAHELTHMVRGSGAVAQSLFRDRGHVRRSDAPDACLTDRLVSYGLGEAAGTVWRVRQAEARLATSDAPVE